MTIHFCGLSNSNLQFVSVLNQGDKLRVVAETNTVLMRLELKNYILCVKDTKSSKD
jgi:hypothetical protein